MSDPRIAAINARRIWWAQQGPPGDPPTLLCEECGLAECSCPETPAPIVEE